MRDQKTREELLRLLISGERDGELLVALRRFVEGSELSLTRIGTLMGLSPSTLKNWVEGSTSLRPGRILEIKQFLRCHPWRDEWHTPAANLAVKD
jgi:hypothetical protein